MENVLLNALHGRAAVPDAEGSMIISITKENIDREHICCAIGSDAQNKARAQTKKQWLKERFDDGLVFKRLDERGKVFIEYMPVETVWKPLEGNNYLIINCLWVSGKFKGQGFAKKLLKECITDAKKQGKDGVAVVSSDKTRPFLTDKKFYLGQDFQIVDTAFPYFELLALRFNDNAEYPCFTKKAKEGKCSSKKDFFFAYSNQCVFMEEYAAIFSSVVQRSGFSSEVKKLASSKEAKEEGSPFGSFGVYFKGKFLTHELMTEEKFDKLIKETCG